MGLLQLKGNYINTRILVTDYPTAHRTRREVNKYLKNTWPATNRTVKPLAQKLKCWYTGTITRSQQLQQAAVPRGLSHPLLWLTSDGDEANTADTPAINTPVLTQFKCWDTDCCTSSSMVSRAQKVSQVMALLSVYHAQRHGDSNSPSGYMWTDIFLKLMGWAFIWQAKYFFTWIWIICFSINMDHMLSVSIWFIYCQ